MDAPGYSIGKAAKAAGLTVKTVRYYGQIGLIPIPRRRNGGARTGGNRVYGEADVGRLRFIHHARLLDLSLTDIRALLAVADQRGCPSEQPKYQEILRRHLQQIDERVGHLLGLRATMEGLLSSQRQPRGQACSWATCGCMGAAESPPSSAGISSSGARKKEENDV